MDQHNNKKGDITQYKSQCDIRHFKELTPDYESSLNQAASEFEDLLNQWFAIDRHMFTTSFSDHKNRVLMDWSHKNIIASTPIQDQEETRSCWAFAFADTTGTTYAIVNPLVKSQKEFRSSPQDLMDWVYFVKKLPRGTQVDDYGTYGCGPMNVVQYVGEHGVSLLKNYKVKIEKKKLKAYTDEGELEREFQAMRKEKGPRIFFKRCEVLGREPRTGILSIDAVYKFLRTGVVYAQMYYCNGCSVCDGFSAFDGIGVYDEPSHPEGHNFARHAVMVLGVGNKNGKDYLRIRNSHGNMWPRGGPRRGCGDVHIKFFKAIYLLKGLEKKGWNGKEWVTMQV